MKKLETILFVLVCLGSLVDRSSAVVGLNEVLDIIKLAKDIVVAIAKAWNIVDQHVDFSDIPIPLLDKTESKLFGRIGVINAKLDRLGGRVDEVANYVSNLRLDNSTEKLKYDGNNAQRKVTDRFKELDRFVHKVIKHVVDLINEIDYKVTGTSTISMVLHTLPERVRLELRLNDLLDYITRMDVINRNFKNYVKVQSEIERLTLEDFAKYVVSHDSSSVVSLVERIHAFIAPSNRGITDTGLIKLLLKALEALPQDITYGLDQLDSVWSLQLAYADLRGIYALYETFRRFQKQQTAPGRIPSPKQAWTDLAETILYDARSNVEQAMNRVHEVVTKNMFQNAKKEVEGDMLCNSQQSPQQVLYNLYNAIALTELKGYTMIQFSYMLLRLYDQGNFTKEAELMRNRYEERTNNAVEIVRHSMDTASRELWNCDPKKHVKGETYEEITQLLQGYVQNEVDLNSEGTCRENCAEYTYTKSHNCFKNLYCRQQRRCSGKIINCQYFDSDMWICPADPLSSRRYEYIEYENGRVLGRKLGCSRGTTKVDSWWRWLFWHCSYCFCLCDEQGSNSDRYFNMRPALTDFVDNKVVTGLRFVKKNRIIHLQIQEGRLLPRGKIDVDSVHWVPVEDYKITDKKIFNGQDYHTLSWEKRAIDLDDLEADEGYVLTGIRFKEIGSHLNFEIYITPFDFDSGKLINPSSTSIWKDNPNTDASIKNPSTPGLYQPVRLTKVRLQHPDIPTRSPTPSIPTSKSDQYIEFVNSDLDRDAAQTTVPFLDTQKVESLQPVPLSGAGIFHKGRNNFGGFITPKIITYDFSKHLKAAFPEEEVN